MYIMSLYKIWACVFVIPMMTVCASIAQNSLDCFTSKETYKCCLSTMTPYRFVANDDSSVIEYPGCSPQKIWIFLRHGTRYPGKKWTTMMRKELPKIRDSIVESNAQGTGMIVNKNMQNLQNWKASFFDKDVLNLADEGERELVDIAERYQSRFPSLMPEIYNNQTYTFKYTATQRAEESAKHFTLGLFGRKQAREVYYSDPEYKDRAIRFYKSCKRWRDEIHDNPQALEEKEKFVKSSIVKKMLDEVSKRIGFALDYESLNLIYKICAFETAWDAKNNSVWCSLLSIDDFKVFEFAHDLQYYWIDGYGYPLNYEQACSAMTEMFNFFESDDETKTKAYFTHSGTILKLVAMLGIARDENPLRHDSFSNDGKRAWRTSLIDAFASNIAFVLYDCKTQGPSVLVMHQERIVQLTDCPANAPCPLSTMKNKYPDTELECPFDDMCDTS